MTSSKRPIPPDTQIGAEAAEWLVRLEDAEADPQEPYPDPAERQERFLAWVRQSPEHLRAFMEMVHTYRKLRHVDPQRLIDIEEWIRNPSAEVVQLFAHSARDRSTDEALRTTAASSPLRRRLAWAASVAIALIGTLIAVTSSGPTAYATSVGEQRTCKLADGSVVYLNTDSKIEVDLTKSQRNIRLVRGEALFVVEHDTSRPFIVIAGSARIRAVGTQFNVYRHTDGTDVSVVEGVVQVASTETVAATDSETSVHGGATSPGEYGESPSTRLAAGEAAHVVPGRVDVHAEADIRDSVSWRERRLVFRDTPLWQVAREFNRFNHRQIRVEGTVAREMQLTAIFNADHPLALIQYIAKDGSLYVQPDGDNWIIRSR